MKELGFDLFLYFFEFLVALIFITHHHQLKFSILKTVIFGIALFSIGAFLLKFINNDIVNLIDFLIIHLLFFYVLFDVNIKEAFIYSIVLDSVMFLSEIITVNLSAIVLKTPVDIYVDNFYAFVVLTIISKAIYFVLAEVFSFIVEKKKKNEFSKRYMPLFVFPFLSIVFDFLFLKLSLQNGYSSKYSIIFIAISIVMILASLLTFVYYAQLTNKDEEVHFLKAERIKNEADMQYLALLEEKNQQMQIMAHDYKNHLFALSQMSDSPEVKSYIEKISGEIQKAGKGCESGNHTLDIIINKYVAECDRKGVLFDYDVALANLCFVDDYDLVNIVSNLLDNALEAAEKSTEKKIALSTSKVNTYDSLTVTNSCDTSPDRYLKTTKKNKQLHGLGIKSIQKAVKKYDGEMAWKYEDNRKRFKATVILLNKTV